MKNTALTPPVMFRINFLLGALLYWSLVILPFTGYAQYSKKAKPLHFTEMWTWEYVQYDGKKGVMSLFREPKSNYWLLTADDAGFRETDEMTLWFIVKPNGEVLQAFQDGDITRIMALKELKLVVKRNKKLPTYWQSTSNTKVFGDPNLGFPAFRGRGYSINYLQSNDHTEFYIAQTSAHFSALALFNTLTIDAKLPINFPQDLPKHMVPLSEHTTFAGGGMVQYNFKYISQTEYYIQLPDGI